MRTRTSSSSIRSRVRPSTRTTAREYGKTLIDHIQAYLYAKHEWRPREEHSFTPALCNRIDRNTGGIVIAAKTSEALRILNQKIKDREIDKRYLCIVHGTPKPPQGKLEGYLFKDAVKNRVYVTKSPQTGAKTCCDAAIGTLQTKNGLSLVECELITGRTHQIRAQMAAAGHPLLGDGKYGELGKAPRPHLSGALFVQADLPVHDRRGLPFVLKWQNFHRRPRRFCAGILLLTPPPDFHKISSENYTFFIDIPPFSIYDSTQYIRNAGCTVLLYLDGQRLTNAPSAFAGSFAPMPRFERLEIHKVCLRLSNLALRQNLSPNALADLLGSAQDFSEGYLRNPKGSFFWSQ